MNHFPQKMQDQELDENSNEKLDFGSKLVLTCRITVFFPPDPFIVMYLVLYVHEIRMYTSKLSQNNLLVNSMLDVY